MKFWYFHFYKNKIYYQPIPPLDKGGGEDPGGSAEQSSELQAANTEDTEGLQDSSAMAVTAPDSPSKQLPDQISFFSGNSSVEIVYGIMHLYKTKWVTPDLLFSFLLKLCEVLSWNVYYFDLLQQNDFTDWRCKT